MKLLLPGSLLLVFYSLVVLSCQSHSPSTVQSSKTDVIDSVDQQKRALDEYFRSQQLNTEKKYDSLTIKGDSTRNKSTVIDFIDEAPIFNETQKK